MKGMDTLVRNNVTQTWLPVGAHLMQYRRIVSTNQNLVQIDVPLTDAVNAVRLCLGLFDPTDVGQTVGDAGYIQTYSPPNLSTEVGLENLFIDIKPDETGLPINAPAANGVAVGYSGWTEDSWMRNIVCQGFVNSIQVNRTVSRITMTGMSFRRRSPVDNAAGYGADVGISGTQILLVNSETLNTNSSYAFAPATEAHVGGPNVILFHQSDGSVVFQPHQRVGLSGPRPLQLTLVSVGDWGAHGFIFSLAKRAIEQSNSWHRTRFVKSH
jgi:hypothetical protein